MRGSTESSDGKAAGAAKLAAAVRLLRPRQFVKNLFVAAPLFFTPEALTPTTALAVGVAVLAFCLVAGGLYAVNDILDRDADRLHPVKRHRPLAAGTLGVGPAAALAGVCLFAGLALALALSLAFGALVIAYAVLVTAYGLYLKRIALLDVACIALGFVLRVEAGAVVIQVEPSPWILVMTGLLALLIAVGKRRDDLVLRLDDNHRKVLSGYTLAFLDLVMAMLLAATLVAYLIFTTDAAAMARLGAERLYVTAPFVVLGLLRYLQIVMVEQRSGDPTELILTDTFLMVTVAAWIGSFAWLIYL